MLRQLAPYRVHLILGTVTLAWFSFTTLLGVADGDSVFHGFLAAIKEVKPLEWVSGICLWVTIASLVKQNDELRARVQLLESRQ
jgi:hypothetical protein